MARWVSQLTTHSRTARSRGRVAYMRALRAEVEAIATSYVRDFPDREDVTVEVSERLGEERIRQLSGSRDRYRQDLGLLVVLALVDVFGPERVLTLRAEDGVTVSTRRNTREGSRWITRFTPHRVLAVTASQDRILLDASVIRKAMHGDPDALDFDRLAVAHGDRPVSIADGAFAELVAALVQGRLPIHVWAARIARLDLVLDANAPIYPGGVELATIAGIREAPAGFDVRSSLAYYRAAWGILRDVRTRADLDRAYEYVDPAGRRFRVRLDAKHIEQVLGAAATKWSSWVASAGDAVRDLRRDGENLDEEDYRALIRTFLSLDGMTEVALDRLDLAVRMIALRARQAGREKDPYQPHESNDPLDFDLLFGVALPAVVCTADERLIRLAHDTGSSDARRLMLPSELLKTLEARGRS